MNTKWINNSRFLPTKVQQFKISPCHINANLRQESRKGHKWLPTASKCCLHQTMERGLRAAIGTQSPNSILLHWPRGRASNSVNSTQKGTRFPIHQQVTPAQMTQGPGLRVHRGAGGQRRPTHKPRTQRDQSQHIASGSPLTIGFLKSNRPVFFRKNVNIEFRRFPSSSIDNQSRILSVH